MKTKEP
jgi:hypothetical protein